MLLQSGSECDQVWWKEGGRVGENEVEEGEVKPAAGPELEFNLPEFIGTFSQ